MALLGTDYEILIPAVEKAVLKYSSGRERVMNCVAKSILNKEDERKMASRLSDYLESTKAKTLAAKLTDLVREFDEKRERKKRKNGEERSSESAKRAKFREGVKENVLKSSDADDSSEDKTPAVKTAEDSETTAPPPADGTTLQKTKDIMADARRLIMERKKQLETQIAAATAAAPLIPIPPPSAMMGLPLMQRPPRPGGGGFGGQQRFNYAPRHQANANFRMNAVTNLQHRGPMLIPPPGIVLPPPPVTPVAPGSSLPPPAVVTPKLETPGDRAQRIMDLQAEIQNRLGAAGIAVTTTSDLKSGKVPPLMPEMVKRSGFDVAPKTEPVPRTPTAPQPGTLKLDERGRMVDASGNEIQISQPLPELKANLRAIKKREKKEGVETGTQSVVKQEASVTGDFESTSDMPTVQFFDPRVNMKSAVRSGRRFQFHDAGKFVKLGTQLRMKAQLEKVQNEINQLAKKTGISSVTKLALATSSIQKVDKLAGTEDIPEVEWWDVIVLKGKSYGETEDEIKANVNEGRITNLIEHPTHLQNPGQTEVDPILPVFLTKKEQKKKRRQNRREAWKEKQEKIRLGLEPAPEPKMTISNLMRVLGTDAVQDPTKVEAHVREQMAKRQRVHQEANAARKLTKEQKREKKVRKLNEDVSAGVRVAVYRVKSLTNPAKKFKVEMNCKQLQMTGCVVLHKETNVVVVEGGPKQQKKYKRLMLQRIKWNEDKITKGAADGKGGDDQHEAGSSDGADVNKCVLVWEGTVKERCFGDIMFKFCPTESFARDFFKKRGVEHYWDLSYSGAVLEAAEDN